MRSGMASLYNHQVGWETWWVPLVSVFLPVLSVDTYGDSYKGQHFTSLWYRCYWRVREMTSENKQHFLYPSDSAREPGEKLINVPKQTLLKSKLKIFLKFKKGFCMVTHLKYTTHEGHVILLLLLSSYTFRTRLQVRP